MSEKDTRPRARSRAELRAQARDRILTRRRGRARSECATLAGTRALWAYVGASNTEYHFDLFTLAEALDAVLCRATSPVS